MPAICHETNQEINSSAKKFNSQSSYPPVADACAPHCSDAIILIMEEITTTTTMRRNSEVLIYAQSERVTCVHNLNAQRFRIVPAWHCSVDMTCGNIEFIRFYLSNL